MSFGTISAILRGRWLIEKSWVSANLPLIMQLAKGETADFGMKPETNCTIKRVSAGGNAYSVNYYTDLSKLPDGSIAVVNISGPLMKQGDMCSYGMLDYTALVNRINNSSSVKGMIVNMDSPGGQVDGTATLADSIRNTRQRKPVISLIDDGIAASAGYWCVSPADEIYVSQATDMVGSIGVYTTIADWITHYKEYWNLPMHDVYAPQSTDKNLDYREAVEGNDALVKADLKVIADQFINTVKRNRGARLTGTDWMSGKMFYAADAKKQGLIDGVKNMDQVIKRMNELIG